MKLGEGEAGAQGNAPKDEYEHDGGLVYSEAMLLHLEDVCLHNELMKNLYCMMAYIGFVLKWNHVNCRAGQSSHMCRHFKGKDFFHRGQAPTRLYQPE